MLSCETRIGKLNKAQWLMNEIWATYEEGVTLYALIWRKTDDKVYDQVAGAGTFVTYTDVDIDDYDVLLGNLADSDYHSVDFPAGIAAGVYHVQVMRQLGAIDADADTGVFQGVIAWDGTAEVDIYTVYIDTNEIQGKLPDDYIMGSSVTDSMDDEMNAMVGALGQVRTVEDESPGGGAPGWTSGIAEGF